VQAGRRGQAVSVHGAQAARSLDVRATVFVFVRDRARGERPAPPRREQWTVQQQRRQADVPVAVPERQQRLEIGLHKGAQRVRVHGADAQEKATKAEAEERRCGGQQWRRQEQVATMSDDQDDDADDDNDDITLLQRRRRR